MIRCTERRARCHHRCTCGNTIRPGERYLEHVASPDHDDLGTTHWWRLAECEDCAIRYGRLATATGEPS